MTSRRAGFGVATLGCLVVAGGAAGELPGSYLVSTDSLVFGGNWYAFETEDERDARRLYRQPMAGGPRSLLYQGERPISAVEASPDGRHLAFVEHFFEAGADAERATYQDRRVDESGELVVHHYYENRRLRILTADGETVADFDRVRGMSWSPDGKALAYITGSYEEGVMGFTPDGVWIYTLDGGAARRIHDEAWELEWARWDGNLYLWLGGSSVRRFDVKRQRSEASPHRGIHFSPDGRYYYGPAGDGNHLRIFTRRGDREVTDDYPLLATRQARFSKPRGWLDADTLIIPSSLPQAREDLLLQLGDDGRMVRAPGKVFGRRGEDGRLVTLSEGRFVELAEAELKALPKP